MARIKEGRKPEMTGTDNAPKGPTHLNRRALKGDRPIPFDLQPDAAALEALAGDLGIRAIRKLRFSGEVRPQGRADWSLSAQLGATVVQGCVVTLEDVVTRIDERVTRDYSPDVFEPEGEEIELDAEDGPDPLGEGIDLAAAMEEALSLALPAYPRAPGAELGEAVFTEPGKEAMTDEDARPFAALKGLRDGLKGD